MNRQSIAIVTAVALLAVGVISWQRNEFGVLWALGERNSQPRIAAPAPPQSAPSRKQTGGPDARLAWQTKRLADPATGQIPADIHRREMAFAAQLPSWSRGVAYESIESAPAAEKINGWDYRGPWNIGGRTRALAIDVSDPTSATLLAGGVSGGMWRTVDEGATWNLMTGSSQLHSVSAIAQDTRPGHRNAWYYGTGEIRGNSAGAGGAPYRGDGIFKSLNWGQSWTLLPATAAGDETVFSGEWQYVNRLAVDPSEMVNDEVYAAVYGFIERSLDGGDSWTRVLGDTGTLSRYTDVVVSQAGVVYASLSSEGGTTGVFRSTDGVNWTDITPDELTGHNRAVMALAPADESILYVLTSDNNGTTNEGFYKYQYLGGDGSGVDGGIWTDRSASMASLPGPGGSAPMECYSSYCQMVTVNPLDPEIVYIGGIHLIRSTDGFATNNSDTWIGGWQYDNHHADQHWLVFRPGSATVAYSASDGGVHKTDNIGASSVNWESLSNGYNTSQFYTVAIDENLPGSDVVIGGMQDNGTWFTASTTGSQPWVELLGGDGSYCAVADASGTIGTYLVSVQNGVVYRITANNTTGDWQSWTRVDPTGGGEYLFINPLIVNPNDTRQLFVTSSNGVWRNRDVTDIPAWSDETTSVNWDHLTSVPSAAVTALAMTREPNPTLYYGTENGRVYRLDNADVAPAFSTPTQLNMGPSWPLAGYVADIAIHPDASQIILVAISNYGAVSLFFSTDGGANWSAVEGNLGGADGPSVRAVACVPFAGTDIFFAGTSTGLYSTTTMAGDETIWSLEAADLLGNVVVDRLASRPADGLVVAGSHGKGVCSLEIPVGTAVGDDLPRGDLTLRQNVPNPFNPLTQISFNLARAGQTRLVVYDVAGREVRTLVAAELPAGEHTVSWNGADDDGRQVAAGVYLYRLRSGAVDAVRRMTLVR